MNRFSEFNRYTNSPIANYNGELYSLPFNMYTFHQMWGVNTPKEAVKIITSQRHDSGILAPKNLEEQAISLVGTDIYEKLIKGYTEKQWGRPCRELPSFIIRRLPVRIPTTTITSPPDTRASPLAVTPGWSKRCSMESKFG